MKIYIRGIPSYEPEHLARMFFAGAQLVQRYPAKKSDAVVIHCTNQKIMCALRQNKQNIARFAPRPLAEKDFEYAVCALLYSLLCEATGKRLPWGMLTGVRPVRIIHDLRAKGCTEREIEAYFKKKYRVSGSKFNLALETAARQRAILQSNTPRSYSLYISIPFCPSRCSYCSFVSRTTAESGKLIEPYIDALCAELRDIRALAVRNKLHLETIYIGGGTPTAISAGQLRKLMQTVLENFDVSCVREYTVEAGRPDCTTPEKLEIIKAYGATRISINPQTLSDDVLRAIGRRHTAQDIIDCFHAARAAGHQNINMDLIAGLPLDTPQGFAQSLAGVISLAPENITVHTLTLKRASNLVIEHAPDAYGDVAQMLAACDALYEAGYGPYYLYRQKNTLQNLENTGYTKAGFEGMYNVFIMEEIHTILSAGAGGSTKLVAPSGGRIERIFNHKYPLEYIERADVVRARKKGVDDFYARYLDSQTPG